MINDYIVVTARGIERIQKAVNEKIRDGYELQGGISMVLYHVEGEGRHLLFHQAMVKRD